MWNIYDFATFAGKPTPMVPGMRKGKLYWESQFFSGSDHSQLPSEGALRAIGLNALSLGLPSDTPFCIDIESWPIYTVGGGDRITLADAKIAAQKYIDTLKAVKVQAPALRWGVFGAALPMEDGFYALSRSHFASDIRGAAYQKLVVMRNIAAVSDILFPSCYAYSDNPREWHRSFKLQIEMCHMLSTTCQVIPFLWPQFPPVVPDIGGQFIPPAFWREMLEHCFDVAGGAAIYGQTQMPWSTAGMQPWVLATQEFIAAHGLS